VCTLRYCSAQRDLEAWRAGVVAGWTGTATSSNCRPVQSGQSSPAQCSQFSSHIISMKRRGAHRLPQGEGLTEACARYDTADEFPFDCRGPYYWLGEQSSWFPSQTIDCGHTASACCQRGRLCGERTSGAARERSNADRAGSAQRSVRFLPSSRDPHHMLILCGAKIAAVGRPTPK
jgi:hypothetical protein